MMTLDRDQDSKHIVTKQLLAELRLKASLDWRLSNGPRRVLDVLLSYANPTGVVEMSYTTLADILGVSRPYVVPVVKRLIDAGYLVCERAVDTNGAPLTNIYRLTLPGKE
jgi:DNA-binding MarR family transcriptional regulator